MLYLLLGALFSELGEEKKKREEGEKGILRVLSSYFSAFFGLSLGSAWLGFVRGCSQLRVSGGGSFCLGGFAALLLLLLVLSLTFRSCSLCHFSCLLLRALLLDFVSVFCYTSYYN